MLGTVMADPRLNSVGRGPAESAVSKALRTIRAHLGMDVAFVSEFVGDRRVFRHVEGGSGPNPIRAGQSLPLTDGYCLDVVEGRLPGVIPNTAENALAASKPLTCSLPIGSHISVPLHLSDGQLYGTFCCFSANPDPTLNHRDLSVMRAFADLVALQIEADVRVGREQAETRSRVETLLRPGAFRIVFQPISRLSDGLVVGAEALARFGTAAGSRSPDRVFAEAGTVGLRTELEVAAIRHAISDFRQVWATRRPLRLGVNASPTTIVEADLTSLLESCPARMVVLEITEHDHIEDYSALLRALAPLRSKGVQVAVDDAGAGYSSLRHVLNLVPDIIKLDVSLTRDVATDPVRSALASSLVEFGRRIDCQIVAEGVEKTSEQDALRDLGVFAAQGYLLHRPGSIETLLAVAE